MQKAQELLTIKLSFSLNPILNRYMEISRWMNCIKNHTQAINYLDFTVPDAVIYYIKALIFVFYKLYETEELKSEKSGILYAIKLGSYIDKINKKTIEQNQLIGETQTLKLKLIKYTKSFVKRQEKRC